MRQIFTGLVFLLLLTSCADKKYKYAEVVIKESPGQGMEVEEQDPKTISAASDSAAYLKAFETFCVSRKVSEDMRNDKESGYYMTPLKFRLYNEKGIDIAGTVSFSNKSMLERDIEARWFLQGDSLLAINSGEAVPPGQGAAVDSAQIKALDKLFRVKEDEFSNENRKWYKPKSSPVYTDANGIFCYFNTDHGVPGPLRFRLQYYSDSWLFFSRVQFSIDGKAYEYIPSDTETDSGNGGHIWEWFDERVNEADKELINALASAKTAKMKLIGRQYYNIKTITKEQINAFKNTIELYRAIGGKW